MLQSLSHPVYDRLPPRYGDVEPGIGNVVFAFAGDLDVWFAEEVRVVGRGPIDFECLIFALAVGSPSVVGEALD